VSLEWFEVDLCAFFKIEAEGDMSPLFPQLSPSLLSAEHYLGDLIRSWFLLLSYLLLTLSSSTIALAGVFSLNLHHWSFNYPFLCRYEDVNHYESKAPHPKMAHPRPDHFYPLHVAMGAAGEDSKAKLVHSSWTDGTLSYASYQFTAPK
jgi:hypothetical protein